MVFYPCRSSSSNNRNQPNLAHTLNDLEQQQQPLCTKKDKKVKRSKTHVDNVLYNNRHSGRKSLLSSDGVVLFSGFVDWITLKRLRENKERGEKYEVSTDDVQLSTPAFEQVSRIDPVKSGFMARKSDRDGVMKCAAGTLVKDEWAEQCRKSPPRPTTNAATADTDKEEIGLFCTPQKKDSGGGALLFGSSGGGGIMDMCSISPTTNTAGVNDSFGTVSTMASSCSSPTSSDIKKSNNTVHQKEEESNKGEEESIWCDVFGSVLEEETDDKNRQQQQLLEEEEERKKKKLSTPEKKIRGIQNVEVVYGDDDKKKKKKRKGGRRKSWFGRSSTKKKKSSTTPSLSFREKYL